METIDVRQLGPEVTKLHWVEPAGALGLNAEPEFQFPIDIELGVRRVGTGVFVEGTVKTRVRMECSRCLEPVERDVSESVAIELLEGPRPEKKEDVIEDEEKEESYYTPPFIDLSDDLRQVLLVTIPAYPVCREDCKGLCPVCGADRNKKECGCRQSSGQKPFEGLGTILKKEQ